ncbi:MAG: hypothetical protein RLZZ21_394 [Planctomycetota bacterium]|jgi:DNA-binding MarR family transcriptional regulator
MKSRDVNTEGRYRADGRWEGPTGPILVEVTRTNSMRDVRGALVALATLLHGEQVGCRAVCVLVGSRLSPGRLEEELQRVQGVLRPELASRIHCLLDKGDRSRNVAAFSGPLHDVPDEFHAWLDELVATERLRGHSPQLPPRQIVVATLAQLRLRNQPPVTVKRLQETCGVSYPTVASVLKELSDKGWLEDRGERGVRMRQLTSGEWMELARDHARLRKVHLFTDPTGHTSAERMSKRLVRLQGAGKLPRTIRIGGVLGASRHFPDLDITAAPRLDLSIDGDPAQIAELIDAGLRPKTKAEQRVALAVHVTRDPPAIPAVGSRRQGQWAGELECLADLVEMGFIREASEMADHMQRIGEQGRPVA